MRPRQVDRWQAIRQVAILWGFPLGSDVVFVFLLL